MATLKVLPNCRMNHTTSYPLQHIATVSWFTFFTYFSNFSMLSLLPRYHAVSECEWYWSHLSTANWNRISHTLTLNILIIFCHGEDMKRPLQGNKIHTCYWSIMMMNKSLENFSPYSRTKQKFYLSSAKTLYW